MIPTPKGYIDLLTAREAYVKAALGGLKPARRRKMTTPAGNGYELLDVKAARAQVSRSIDWLLGELGAGRVTAEAGGKVLPAEYWRQPVARTTAHIGYFEPPDRADPSWRGMTLEPCYIERRAFDACLSAAVGSKTSTARRGRKPGDGARDDTRAFEEMYRLLSGPTPPSLRGAAKSAAPLADRGNSEPSTVDRLRKNYKPWVLKSHPAI